MDGKVFLSRENFEKQPIQTAIDIPVDVAEIISSMIAPVITELQPHTPAQRRAIVLALAPEGFAGQQPQGLQLAHKLGIEQRAFQPGTFTPSLPRSQRACSGRCSTMSRIRSALSIPSASPSKFKMRRWRRHARATVRISSTLT